MLGGRGRTKRAVGAMRGIKLPKSSRAGLRLMKMAKKLPKNSGVRRQTERVARSTLGAVPTRGGRPTPRSRAAARQRRAMLRGARVRPRGQARRG